MMRLGRVRDTERQRSGGIDRDVQERYGATRGQKTLQWLHARLAKVSKTEKRRRGDNATRQTA